MAEAFVQVARRHGQHFAAVEREQGAAEDPVRVDRFVREFGLERWAHGGGGEDGRHARPLRLAREQEQDERAAQGPPGQDDALPGQRFRQGRQRVGEVRRTAQMVVAGAARLALGVAAQVDPQHREAAAEQAGGGFAQVRLVLAVGDAVHQRGERSRGGPRFGQVQGRGERVAVRQRQPQPVAAGQRAAGSASAGRAPFGGCRRTREGAAEA